jgi:hypothetical protein
MTLSDVINRIGRGDLQGMLDKFNAGQHDDVPDSQVHDSYGQVATQIPQDQYEQAARDAFEKLTPQQREQFAKELQQQTQQRGVNAPAAQTASSDPGSLASAVGEVHAEQPNLLQQMFAPGGVFSNPAAKAALLGITAMAAQRLMGSRR